MVQSDWPDEEIPAGLLMQRPEALEALIARYSREVYYFIRLVLGGVGTPQDAEECTNDLFVAVWQEIESYAPSRGTFRTWLIMRARYIALDRRRQLQRSQANTSPWQDATLGGWPARESAYRPGAFGQGEARDAGMETLLEQSERREELERALAMLPEFDRHLVYLRYFQFATTEEIAAKTGLTKHAVDTRLWRARKSLKEALEERSGERVQPARTP
jgi:RNA polymerase sigma factor (sigma-70 family)